MSAKISLTRADVGDRDVIRLDWRYSSSVSSPSCQNVIEGRRVVSELWRGGSGGNQSVTVRRLPAIQYVFHQGRVR